MTYGIVNWWTEERVAELRERWANNETYGQICAAMGKSRSAVIGKAHRLKLFRLALGVKSPTTIVRIKRPRRVRLFDIKGGDMIEDEPPISPIAAIFAEAKRFIELANGDCRWPGPGQPGPDLLCCGAPIVRGYPYCAAHCRIAYTLGRPPRP